MKRPRSGTRAVGPRRRRPAVFLDGFSESAWKSLLVKGLRMGWPAGMSEAASRLAKSTAGAMLICSIFEDVFPAIDELSQVIAEVKWRQFEKLCRRQTHHGRGYTGRFCELEAEAVHAAEHRKAELWAAARERKLWLPPRSLNCWYTWLIIQPADAGQERTIDATPWAGMPTAILDGHTYEGKETGRKQTILSGHYEQHLRIAGIVAGEGWEPIRREVHGQHARPRRDLFHQGEEGDDER